MDYLHKIEKLADEEDLLWNIPEQKQGYINVVGGNLQSFRAPVKVAEFLSKNYPLKTLSVILPDALKTKMPLLPNLVFLSSTDSGSFKNTEEITGALDVADFNLLVGDFSKNSITAQAVAEACQKTNKPLVVTRDTVDLLAEGKAERILMNENLILMGSMAQLQKIFRAAYYPRVLLLTQSLVQVAEALHKFTLSYPVSIITLHDGQILVAKNGEVNVAPLEKTAYSPLSLWDGELAARITALNLYNPNNYLKTTTGALFLR